MKIRNIDFRAKASVFLLIAAGTLFQSCQQDGVDEWTDGEDELVPIEVQAGITGDVVATRATATYEKLPENSTIGIFCMSKNNYDLVKDVKYTNSSGTWQPADKNRVIYVGAETAKLCAYYCPSEVTFLASGNGKVILKPHPYEGNDLCYASAPIQENVWKGSPQASFNMGHAYTRMTFILKRDPSYVGDCKVTNLCLDQNGGNNRLLTSYLLDISTGSYSRSETAPKLEWDMESSGWSDLAENGIPASDTKNSKNIDLLLVPQNISAEKLMVQLTVDGKVLSVVPAKSFVMHPGIHNIFTLILKNTSLELGSVETQNWTEVTVGSGDYEIK